MDTSKRKRSTKSSILKEKLPEKLSLHEKLNELHLAKIHEAFQTSHQMDRKQLEELLHEVANIIYEENEFELEFFRINAKRDGLVTWDEFISYLILGFMQNEVSLQYHSLELPISKAPRIIRSYHRHPINRITFFPTMKQDGSFSFSDGSYITCSKDGTINYWSLDVELDRTVQSSCPELKIQPTWVLDLVCLPDVTVICTSGAERDLRFYDTSARKFELRVMITSLDFAVTCMHYEFKDQEECKLIMGDTGGNVKILLFSPIERGPFKSKSGIPLLHICYERIVKGLVPEFRLVEFRNAHTNWIRQVSYYKALHCVVSCAACPKAAVLMKDITESKSSYVYKIPKGAWCFVFSQRGHVVATGSPDCLVRIWNPFIPTKPSVTFSGHHSGIVALIMQDAGNKLYSLSQDRCIKVWDIPAQTCLQTYVTMPAELGEHSDFTIFCNPDSRQLLIGCITIVVLHLCPKQSGEHTDGNTHQLGVSTVLYNPLFRIIVTCGLDSNIIVWDPWTGGRMSVIRNAHTRPLHGELLPVEITAACFDPGYHSLLTGATNGSLKTWNFNTGTCLRNMSIEPGCEVSDVIWIKGRILAIGWNRHITEFADGGVTTGSGGTFSKSWATRHEEDVLCATVRVPQTLVTSTYSGDLILWRLETGQPYKRYNVSNPTTRIKIDYKIDKTKPKKQITNFSSSGPSTASTSDRSSKTGSMFSKRTSGKTTVTSLQVEPTLTGPEGRKSRTISMVQAPESCVPLREMSVHCMIFLASRPMAPKVGTLLVAVENGAVQIWSHHAACGFLSSFSAIHKAGDYVISMSTDTENEYLFTGTTAGYVKIWLMKDYFTPQPVKICMPKYRIIFPFLWTNIIEGRAKRMTRGQPKPLLLSSYKAHLLPVSGLDYINDAKILISCSADCSARLWTLGGKYLGTLGTFKPWIPIPHNSSPSEQHQYQIPADIKRSMSSTTFKIFHGGISERKSIKKTKKESHEGLTKAQLLKGGVYGKRLKLPY